MKKFICLVLITGLMHSTLAMEQGRRLLCYGQSPDDQTDEQARQPEQEVDLGIMNLVSSAGTWLKQNLDALDEDFGAGAADRQAQQEAMAPHIKVVRDALAHGTLPQAIEGAAKEGSPDRFLSLLKGMKHLGIQPTNETQSVIQQRLHAIKLARVQQTKKMLESIAQRHKIYMKCANGLLQSKNFQMMKIIRMPLIILIH